MTRIPKHIAIVKGVSFHGYSLPSDTLVIQAELRNWVKSWSFLKHLWRYESACLLIYQIEFLSHPFFHALLLRLLSRGSCFFQDELGEKFPISLAALVRLFYQYGKALIYRPKLLARVRGELAELSRHSMETPGIPEINSSYIPVYLRTDLHFGVKCGGAIAHTAGVLNQFFGLVGSVLFLTPETIPTILKEIEVHEIPPSTTFMDFRELFPLAYNHECVARALPILQGRKIAFLYQRYSLSNYSGLLLSRRLHVPFVLEYNGSEIWINEHWGTPLEYSSLSKEIELLNVRTAHLVVVVSQILKNQIVDGGVQPSRVLVNPNGVDPEVFHPQVDGRRIRQSFEFGTTTVLGFLGTFGRWHGAEVLVRAFVQLLHAFPVYRDQVRLLLIGDGVTLSAVRQIIERGEVSDSVVYAGSVPQSEAPTYLAACDILISPHVPNTDGTPFFGSPTKLFEYMAMGKGIVASRLNQIQDILIHNETGWLVEPGDVDSLRHGIKMLIDNPALRQRLGQVARRHVVENYTWTQHTERILSALHK